MYVYIYIYVYVYMYIHIYIYILLAGVTRLAATPDREPRGASQ